MISAKKFDASKYFDTHPALLGRTHNRLRNDQLKSHKLQSSLDEEDVQVIMDTDNYGL